LKKQHKQASDTFQEFIDNYPKLYAEYQKLHKDIKVNLEKIQTMKLSKTQKEYQKELDKQYLDHYSATKTDFAEKLEKQKKDFDAKLEEEYERACDAIKFNEIEYKKTITKKRKEYNRKNKYDAKPQRKWRYIDEE